MKRNYTLLLFLLATVSILAQTPEKMSYQLVLRDASNTLLTNQEVGMEIRILQSTITGTAVYVETQTATTNINGLVSIAIGSGASSDDFSAIDWSAGPYFIKIATDPSGGSSYTITGTSQIMSVPFAMFAKTSGSSMPGPQGAIGIQGAIGAIGAIGATGASGTQGVQGETGTAGADGAAGANGSNGTKGDQGAQGIQGETGSAGTIGERGDTGDQGAQGIQGATGTAGTNGTAGDIGPSGELGATGLAGENGANGNNWISIFIDPSSSFPGVAVGDQWLNTISGDVFEWDGFTWNGTGNIQGTNGATGPSGLAGAKGIQGETGIAGAQGTVGDTGVKGDTGATGADGATGIPTGGTEGQVLKIVGGIPTWIEPVTSAGQTFYEDTDNDGYGDINSTLFGSAAPNGYVSNNIDCNDTDAAINPATVWYLDTDADNYAVSTITQCASPGVGYTQTALSLDDCNDNDATINPDTVWYLDADGDNYAISNTIQCSSPGEGYTQTALLLGDCNDNDVTINPVTIWYLDGDGDNYAISIKTQCTNPGAGYTNTVLPLSDCNDTDGSINPGNIEDLENGIDDDCDGKIDEVDIGDLIQGGIVFWLDPENNMRGKVCYYKDATDAKIWNNAKTYCNELAVTRNTVLYDDWYLPSIDDLKLMYDNKTTINTTALANLGGSFEDYTYWSSSEFDNLGASIQSFTNGNQSHNVNKGDTGRVRAVRAFCNVQTEVPYDGIDNDCNAATLDDDLDGDGFVNANDCNDSDAAINPTTVWYLDADGDNYAISTKTQCINPGVGYTATVLPLSDCNDSDGSINPGVTEVRYDDIDNDCNAATLDDEAKVGDSRDGGIVFWVDPTNKAKGKVCWLLNGNNANWNDAMAYCNGLEVTRDNVFYDDWYLPSIWELNLIWWNLYKSDKRNFKDHWYWSSTDNGDNYRAWEQDFSSLSSQRTADYKVLKSSKAYSRAVRAF